MKFSKKITICLSGLGLLGASYFAYQQFLAQQNQKVFSQQQIYKIMRDFKSQLYSVWIQVADIRNKVVAENNNSTIMNGKDIKDVLQDETKKLFKAKKRIICLKYDLQESELDKYVDDIYSNDEQIQNIQREISKCFYDSIKGIKPELNINPKIIEKFSLESVLTIVEQILRECGTRIAGVYQELRNEGETDFSISNQKLVQKIKALKLGDLKNQLLKSKGMDFPEEEEAATEIFTKICSKYKQESDIFNEKITKLEKKYDELMDYLTDPNTKNYDKDICEKIFNK